MEEKRLSNLKTDFINNMTHELKTPLATITVAGKTLEMAQIRSNDSKILETAKLIGKAERSPEPAYKYDPRDKHVGKNRVSARQEKS